MYRFLAVFFLLASCSNSIGSSQEGTADGRPLSYTDPPEPKEGTGTAPACEGVQGRGECQSGVMVFCDLSLGRLQKVDCEAKGEHCIEDVGRGAMCKDVDDDPGAATGPVACELTNTTEQGFCTEDGVATFCDTSGSEPITREWPCAAAGQVCENGRCATTDGAPPVVDCGTLDYAGICDGDTARWCDPQFGVQEKICPNTGQRCEEDTCAEGAYCCGEVIDEGSTDPCDALGSAGQCLSSNLLEYCDIFGIVQQETCSSDRTCLEGSCASGAACCEIPDLPVNECTTLGIDGICTPEGLVRYCVGTSDDDIIEFSCGEGLGCVVDDCAPGAQCCAATNPCDNLGPEGQCTGDVLSYCLSGSYTEINCEESASFCTVIDGYADCE